MDLNTSGAEAGGPTAHEPDQDPAFPDASLGNAHGAFCGGGQLFSDDESRRAEVPLVAIAWVPNPDGPVGWKVTRAEGPDAEIA